VIDKDVLEIYIEPSPYQDQKKLGLTWVLESLDESQMSIQVFYEFYEYLSQEGIDTLVTKIKNKDVFISQKDGKQMFSNGYEIKEKIRKQIPPPS
jgi:hypothetical protein